MSPQHLFKCKTHHNPEELVIWNMLGAFLCRQCNNENTSKWTQSQTPGKWNHLEVIRALDRKT
jgi:hypothetical protein